jgi:hypothetical protein
MGFGSACSLSISRGNEPAATRPMALLDHQARRGANGRDGFATPPRVHGIRLRLLALLIRGRPPAAAPDGLARPPGSARSERARRLCHAASGAWDPAPPARPPYPWETPRSRARWPCSTTRLDEERTGGALRHAVSGARDPAPPARPPYPWETPAAAPGETNGSDGHAMPPRWSQGLGVLDLDARRGEGAGDGTFLGRLD